MVKFEIYNYNNYLDLSNAKIGRNAAQGDAHKTKFCHETFFFSTATKTVNETDLVSLDIRAFFGLLLVAHNRSRNVRRGASISEQDVQGSQQQ